MSNSSTAESSLGGFSNALADAVAKVEPGVVAIHARRRIPASGVVWRNGLVVTADHTIRRETGISVTLGDGRTLDASIVGRDPGTDIALLKLSDDNVPAVTLGDDASLRVGQIVLAVGRAGEQISATLGAVHAVGGEWRTWLGGHLARSIRLDLPVHDGFSGGPLIDVHGRVMGINSSTLARGTPVSIPVATVNRVVDELLAGGRVRRGWLGIGTQPVRIVESVQQSGVTQDVGLLIINIAADSPAQRASLHIGDTLIALAGTATRTAEDVQTILGSDTVGRTLTARIVRAGAVVEVPVEIGESPHRVNHDEKETAGRHEHGPHHHRDMNWYAYAFGRGFGRGRGRDRGDRGPGHGPH